MGMSAPLSPTVPPGTPGVPIAPPPPSGQPELVRALGTWTSAAIVVGVMIGSGVFLKPAEVAREAGTVGWALAAWVGGAVLCLLGTLSYLELGTAMPEAGGNYVYLRRAFGPTIAFLYGWRSAVVSGPASTASQAAAVMLLSSYLLPGLARPLMTIPLPMPGSPGQLVITGMNLGAFGIIAVICIVNVLGVLVAGRAQVALTLAKVGAVAAIILAAFALGDSNGGSWEHVVEAGPGTTFGGFVVAVAAALWAFSGWRGLLRVGSEIHRPERTMPRAMLGGLGLTAFLYVLLAVACFYMLGFGGVAGSHHVVSDLLDRLGGRELASLLTLAMIVSVVGSMNGSMLTGGRVPYAMGRDGSFPGLFGRVHPVTRAPTWALVLPAGVASLLALTGTFTQLTGLVVFAQWTFYALGVLALFRLRRTEPDMPRPMPVWGYPVVPGLFFILSATLTVTLLLEKPGRSLVGVVLILAGLPVLWYLRRRARANGRTGSAGAPGN